MFKLTFHRGSLSGETLSISTPQIVLGRSREDCDVWLNDDGVSREHCRIEEREDGLYISDLDSRNGTWVNRQKITEHRLASGDDVRIGPVKLTFAVVEPAPLHYVVAETSPRTATKRSLSLAGLLAFLRTSYGGVFVGLSIGTSIALLLLLLLPKQREQVADIAERTPQPPSNAFANNNDFSLPPPDRNAPPRQLPIPAAQQPQEQVGQNDPDLPKADNAPAIERKDSETPLIQGEARIITGFDSSYPRKVARVGENHFTIDMKSAENNFFLFKIEGAAGKKIRVDLINLPSGYAPSLNPVYSYVKSLDDLDSLISEKPEIQKPLRKAKNGPPIPDTSGQKWHYLENVSYGRSGGADARALRGNPLLGGMMRGGALGSSVLSFEETFEQDKVFVSMRFPYTYGYNEAFLTKLAQDFPWVKVHNVGKSKEGRNLRVVQIGEGVDRKGNQKPTAVIYAREHGNEHDTSHVVEGAIRSLVSDDDVAIKARSNFCFILIPLLDPDGATNGKYDSITDSYYGGSESVESLAYASWFKKWVDDGKRLDLVINMHNVRSAGFPHLFSPMMEKGRLDDCKAFHGFVVGALKNYQVDQNIRSAGYSRFRMGGWLQEYFGALYVAYECNSQAPASHLSISDLQEMGTALVRASTGYFESEKGNSLLKANTALGLKRTEAWRIYGKNLAGSDALALEEECRDKVKDGLSKRRQNENKN
jgi:hypothetical protein